VLVKLEALNPGGSIKARSALGIIEQAERTGQLKPGGTIIEATSGNQGIAIAMIGAIKGYRVIICLPENMSVERRRILKAYGAELVLTPVRKDIKETLESCLAKVREIIGSGQNVFWACQFDNPANSDAHYRTTAQELLRDLGTEIHAFVAGIGTGGTITGVGRCLKENVPSIQVIAAEPAGAPLLSGGPMGHHVQEGIGDGIMPGILDTGIIDSVEVVTDDEAVATARRLAREEGLFCGISTGTTVCAAVRVAKRLGPGKTVVAVMADGGEKYLSTRLCEGPGAG
jgi:cysteine synthase A